MTKCETTNGKRRRDKVDIRGVAYLKCRMKQTTLART